MPSVALLSPLDRNQPPRSQGAVASLANLVSAFHGSGVRAMAQLSPASVLQRAPEEEVELSGPSRDSGKQICRHRFLCGCFRDRPSAPPMRGYPSWSGQSSVVIAGCKGSPKNMLLPFRAREGEILKIDIQLRVAVHVEDALIGAGRHCSDVPRA